MHPRYLSYTSVLFKIPRKISSKITRDSSSLANSTANFLRTEISTKPGCWNLSLLCLSRIQVFPKRILCYMHAAMASLIIYNRHRPQVVTLTAQNKKNFPYISLNIHNFEKCLQQTL
jgi:hypothetical protein